MRTHAATGLEAEMIRKDFSRTDELQHGAFPTVADRRKGMSSKSTGLMQGFLWLGNEIIFR